jgi:hypothetical protein
MAIGRQVPHPVQRGRRLTHHNGATWEISEALFGDARWISGQPCGSETLELVRGSAGISVDPVRQSLDVPRPGQTGEIEPFDPDGGCLGRRHHPPLGCRKFGQQTECLGRSHALIVSA